MDINYNVLYLTQSAISEELNVISHTELLHLGYRLPVNQRLLNLYGEHIKYMLNRCTGEESQIVLYMQVEALPGCLRCGCFCW